MNPGRSLTLLAFIVCGTTASASENQLTAAENAAGWRLLFDGKSFAGWRGYRQHGWYRNIKIRELK